MRARAAFVGISQALAVFVYLWIEMLALDAWVDDWTMTGNMMIAFAVLSLVVSAFLILAYPIFLLIQKQKNDAMIVFAFTAASIGAILFLLYLMAGQWSGID